MYRPGLTFGTRKSILSGSPRQAANPSNAILNYLYAVLESETRLALSALGLDPGLGLAGSLLVAAAAPRAVDDSTVRWWYEPGFPSGFPDNAASPVER